ncbi:FG-GAP-like repeat-containing protein [Aquimarina sp. 2304DJ70-9]|uniref:FG-GAP-like repeat-containing protein n=1 Tax=Aquimarina penaris TaxID=3231044 RepID=UPI00346324C6
MTNFRVLLFLLISFIPLGLMAQLSFEEIEITGKDDVIFNPRLFDHENLDLDQDGDFDILVYSSFTIVWYENRDGAGDFSSAKMIYNSDSSFILNMKIGDLDGDDDIDIVGVRNGTIGWLTNQGDGSFSDFNIIDENFNISAFLMEINDIDGDDDNDILLHLSEGVVWYENLDGLGTFANQEVIIPPFNSFGSSVFLLEDVNGDFKIDIVLFDTLLDQISWYENLGNMTFSAALPFHANLNLGPTILKKVDIDGDANADFIAGGFNNLIWYEFDGIGELSRTSISIEDLNVRSLISTDFDADGDQDLLYYDGDGLFWSENNDGMGTFSTPNMIDSKFCIRCSNITDNRLATGDFDGNGTIDVIASIFSERIGTIFRYSNSDGQGAFDTRKIISDYPFKSAIESMDVDNDGDLDLLVKGSGYYSSIYKNLDGNGNFDRQEAFSGADLLKDSRPIDIDNDGDLDIVSIRDSPNANLVWYENINGSGIFKNAQVINSTIEINIQSTIGDIAVGDIDKDGYQDFVLVQGKDNETVSWLRNENGSGTFSLPIEVGTNVDRPSSVKLGDIDGDGDLDLVVFEGFTGLVKWFKNVDGKGSFAPAVILPNSAAFRGLCLADLDQDNDLDVITFGRDIKWHENTDGAGNFSSPIVVGNPSEFIQFVEIADLDGDFDQDVVWKSWDKKGVFWYENLTGNEDFSAEIPIFISDRPEVNPVTALGDFNGDFKIDIAHADQYEYKVILDTYTPDRLVVLLNEGEQGNQIIGEVKNDLNATGCDGNDPLINNLMITASNGVDSYSTFTLPNGLYSLSVGEGTYTTTVSGALPTYYGASPAEHEFTFNGIGTTESGDFCIEAQQVVNDLEVQLFPLLEVRPGFATRYLLTYKNVGTTVLEGEINLNFNESALNFIEASEAPSAILAGALTFDIGTLLPFESNSIQANFLVEPPPTVTIDDLLVTSANGTITGEDDFLENNESILKQVVIGSYDPNDIVVLEGSQILLEDADDYLHYIIRFQNTGTADAINVKVENILDSNLDWTTFQLESLSHSGRVEIKNGSKVKFIFNTINLPDSTNDEPNSHGFIAYKVKPKNNINIGDIILNKANIFFDFNPPIITNTVNTMVILEYEDDDNDSINNNIDQCPNTPLGETVDSVGCSQSQLDDDNDGINNNIDQCPNTPLNAAVDIKGCILFPENNLNIQTIGETCPNKNNAKIIISANETHNYTASLNGTNYNFTTDLIIDNLTSGNHELCITVASEFYEQCYTIALAEGTTISGNSSSNKSGEVFINIEKGTAPYSVFVNGHVVWQTELSSFSVNASHGDIIEIATSRVCEGKLSQKVNLTSEILAYPNPTNGDVEVNLPITQKEVIIELYTIQSQLISTHSYLVKNGKVNLNLKNQPKGIYFAKVLIEEPVLLKILKK